MTIIHKGIRRKTTDVLDDYGQAHYLQNVRLKRVGEMGRRAGLGKSTMAQLAGPVQFMIGAWSNEPFIVNGTGGDVTGNADPLAYWTGATMRLPGGVAGQPTAPVILGFICTPASPQAYATSTQFTATPIITYDGLSGPLGYSWNSLIDPMVGGLPITGPNDGTTCVYDPPGASGPGDYGGLALIVTPAGNPGFAAGNGFTYQLT